MKKNTHPKYQQVLFVDSATGTKFLCGTTLAPETTEKYEGKEYPTYKVPISAASHPFFTGSTQLLDAEGRVDKFRKRYAPKPAAPAPAAAEPAKKTKAKTAK